MSTTVLGRHLGVQLKRAAGAIALAARARDEAFAIAAAASDGTVHGIGDVDLLAIQSISKVFALALGIATTRQPSGGELGASRPAHPYDSPGQLERDRGMPRNPLVNAGAMVVTDVLIGKCADALRAVRDLLHEESGATNIVADPEVVADEQRRGDRNAAIGHLIASYGNLDANVPPVLEHYNRQCALSMSCRQLALASLFL